MKSIIIIVALLFVSCGTTKQEENNNTFIGIWCSKSSAADYPHLSFRQDGYVVFDCKIDTIFGLKYSIHNNYLLLISKKNSIIKNKILKHTKDSLVLETLLDLQSPQIYFRCKK